MGQSIDDSAKKAAKVARLAAGDPTAAAGGDLITRTFGMGTRGLMMKYGCHMKSRKK